MKLASFPAWLRQGGGMVVLQAVGKLASLAGGVWAARCLGPEKLGISGVVFVLLPAFYLFAGMRLEVLLVRHFADYEKEDGTERMAATYALFQVVNVLLLFGVGLGFVLINGLPEEGRLSLLLALPVFFFATVQPTWLLQARERMPAFYAANTVLALVNAVLLFVLVRPGSPAGMDLIPYLAGSMFAWGLMWTWALFEKKLPRVGLSALKDMWRLARENGLIFVTGVLMFAYNALEAPLVGWLYSVQELGSYRTALMLANSLATFLQIIPVLLYPRFVRWQREDPDSLRARQDHLALTFGAGALVLSAAAFLIAPWGYRLLYGIVYLDAALPFALLFTGKLVLVISGIYTWGFWAQADARRPLLVIGPVAVASMVADFILIPRYGMLAAATIYLASEVLILAGVFAFSRRRRVGRE